jgi:hypothetical protein
LQWQAASVSGVSGELRAYDWVDYIAARMTCGTNDEGGLDGFPCSSYR